MSRGRVQGIIIAGLAGIASSFYAFQPMIREQAEAQQKRSGAKGSSDDGVNTVLSAATSQAAKPDGGSTGSDQIDVLSGPTPRDKDS